LRHAMPAAVRESGNGDRMVILRSGGTWLHGRELVFDNLDG